MSSVRARQGPPSLPHCWRSRVARALTRITCDEPNAAVPLAGLECDTPLMLVDALGDALQQGGVRAADRCSMALGNPMERAVRQRHPAEAIVDGLVAECVQRLVHGARRRAEFSADFGRDPLERGTDGVTRDVGLLDGPAQELGGKVVVALGNRDDHLAGATTIELGRAPG